MPAAAVLSREADHGEAFRLLSELYRLPGLDLGAKVRALEGTMARACQHATPYVTRMREYLEQDGDVEALQVEYCKLFLGPFGVLAPPYGSVYLDGNRSLMGKSTVDVLNRYKREGLDIAKDFHDAPDHITAELEFVYFLNVKALQAGEDADGHAPARCRERRRQFLMEHLGAWISDFAQLIEENAETEFFKNLVRATKALIHTDLETLSGSVRRPVP